MWIGASFLVLVGLALTGSALPEECQPLVEPLPLIQRALLMGSSNFLAGYTDHKASMENFKLIESCRMNLTAGSEPHVVKVHEENRINGTCVSLNVEFHIDGDRAKSRFNNITSEIQMLPTCDGCMLFSVNSTFRNTRELLAKMNLHMDDLEDEFTAHSLYLMSTNEVLSDSDLEHFKKQASCFGYSGEPNFLYDGMKMFCSEEEGIKLN